MSFTTTYQKSLKKIIAFEIYFKRESDTSICVSIKKSTHTTSELHFSLEDVGLVSYEIIDGGNLLNKVTSEDSKNQFQIKVTSSKSFLVKATILFKNSQTKELIDYFTF
jgi:hypothetical protein